MGHLLLRRWGLLSIPLLRLCSFIFVVRRGTQKHAISRRHDLFVKFADISAIDINIWYSKRYTKICLKQAKIYILWFPYRYWYHWKYYYQYQYFWKYSLLLSISIRLKIFLSILISIFLEISLSLSIFLKSVAISIIDMSYCYTEHPLKRPL